MAAVVSAGEYSHQGSDITQLKSTVAWEVYVVKNINLRWWPKVY